MATDSSSKLESKKSTRKVEVVMATDSVTADINRVVLRAERELDTVEWNENHEGGAGSHGSVIPDTADDMGPVN